MTILADTKFDHPPRGTCVPGCPVYGRCHCLCGMPTSINNDQSRTDRSVVRGRPFVFRRAHHLRELQRPNIRYAYSMPVQRVLPLVEFLFDQYGTHVKTAEAIGVGERAVRAWRRGYVRRVSPGTCRRIVAAVKAEEARLRAAAIEPESLKRRHERHVKEGRSDLASCDYCHYEIV